VPPTVQLLFLFSPNLISRLYKRGGRECTPPGFLPLSKLTLALPLPLQIFQKLPPFFLNRYPLPSIEMDPGTELADWAIKRKRDPSILIRELQKDVIASLYIADPTFGQKKSIYTDFFASSKPLKRFETIMMEKVLPFYANTHTSTTSTSKCTSSSVKRARETVARCTNAISTDGHEHQAAVIFSG